MIRKNGFKVAAVVATLLCALSGKSAWADGAVMLKGGSVRVSDETQLIDHRLSTIDGSSPRTFAISFEHRVRRNGMAFGVEFVSYRHDFVTELAEPGDTLTQAIQFLVHKYFFEQSPVRPFLGIGFGGALTHAEYRQGNVSRDDDFGSFVLQGALGVEFRIDNLSLMLELKRLWHSPGSSDDYNATATGLFGGVGFSW